MDKEKLRSAAIIAACNYDNPLGEPAYDKNFYDGFMAGADYALANQWTKPADGMPEDRQRILICYQSYYKGRYVRLFVEEIYDAEDGILAGIVPPENVIAWMPIPELPY